MNRKSKSLSRSPRQQKSPSPERGSEGLRRDNGSLEENNQKSVYDDDDDDDDADNRND